MPYNIEGFKNLVSRSGGFARSNLYRVLFTPENAARELNLLCTNVQLPGRQILTNERLIGMTNKRISYGFAVPEVTMTFLALNDYFTRGFFEEWQSRVVNTNDYEVGYYKDYVQDIQIQQLKSGGNVANLLVSGNFPKIFKVLDALTEMNAEEEVVYAATLVEAFPTTLTEINFSNEQDEVVSFSVSFSFKDWTSQYTGYKNETNNSFENSVLKKGFDIYNILRG